MGNYNKKGTTHPLIPTQRSDMVSVNFGVINLLEKRKKMFLDPLNIVKHATL